MTEYRIKVTTEEKNEGVTRARDGRLLVRVNAKRKKGSANERAKEVVAKYLQISSRAIVITQGQTQSTKTIRVRDNGEKAI
jgi:uncharacterized protein YggU (UPF0235/DUF167 family)